MVNNMVRLNKLNGDLGHQLVHNIMVRKGNTYLMNKKGTQLKPIAQVIFNRGMTRLAAKENPTVIVADLERQLLLLTGS